MNDTITADVTEAPAVPEDIGQGDPASVVDPRLNELGGMISTYNELTGRLQKSHEVLGAEMVRLQRELASTDAQLQRSKRLAALGEMAAGIAHEIRNPLAAIQLYARMLVDDLMNLQSGDRPDGTLLNGAAHNAHQIASAVRGLNAIVTDVLTFASELRPKPVGMPVAAIFDRAIAAHRPGLEAAGVRVCRQINPPDLRIVADADLLHQAFLNLIRNAIDAMASGGGTLTLMAEKQGDQIVFTVHDTGPGIGPRDIDRIFNPFFTTRSTGTGLGLAIVHRIIEVHAGTIAVSNQHGAVFALCLPAPRSGVIV